VKSCDVHLGFCVIYSQETDNCPVCDELIRFEKLKDDYLAIQHKVKELNYDRDIFIQKIRELEGKHGADFSLVSTSKMIGQNVPDPTPVSAEIVQAYTHAVNVAAKKHWTENCTVEFLEKYLITHPEASIETINRINNEIEKRKVVV